MSDSDDETGHDQTHERVIPPLETVEGIAKISLGTVAGFLLLWLVLQAQTTELELAEMTVYILAAFILSFLGVDIYSVLKRMGK